MQTYYQLLHQLFPKASSSQTVPVPVQSGSAIWENLLLNTNNGRQSLNTK